MSEVNTNAADATATAAEVKPTEAAAPAETKPAEAVAPVVEPKTEAKVEAAVTPAVPEKYELKLAEGTKLSAQVLEEVSTFAKAKGYTNEQAQELLDQKQSAVDSYHQEQQQQLASLNDTTWKSELMTDKELGGAKFEENMILAHSAAEKWFGKEFADSLKEMKLNHHPKLVRGLYRIAKAGANDTFVQSGNQAASGQIPLERQMYPKMFNKESK